MEKLQRYLNEDSDIVNIYESEIKGLFFSPEDMDCTIIIEWAEGDEIIIECKKCSFYGFIFDSKDNSLPLDGLTIHGFSYLKNGDYYIVQINFNCNPVGFIRIHCSSFEFFLCNFRIFMKMSS